MVQVSVTRPVVRRPARRGRWPGWSWVVLSATAIAVFAVLPYLTAPLDTSSGGLAGAYAGKPVPLRVAFHLHVVFGGLALLLGPWQFARRLRDRFPVVHRTIGWASTVCIVVAATAALVVSTVNTAGLVGFLGFGTLAVLWAASTLRAVRDARRGDFASHQAWMIRSFAFTYAAVTLRLWLFALIFLQVPFLTGADVFEQAWNNAYPALPFLCWLPNTVVAEWMVRRRDLPGFRLVTQP